MIKIKLKTKIMLGGKVASPDDDNKGVYELQKNLANSLIARKRAVLYSEKESKSDNDKKGGKSIEMSLEDAKKVADELGIKYNPSIGAKKLLEKIDEELELQAKKYGLEIKEISVKEAMELYRAKKDGKGEEDPEKLQKLKELAEEAEIEFNEDTTSEDLQKLLEVELEKYASEEEIEIPEGADVFAIWQLIKKKIENAD